MTNEFEKMILNAPQVDDWYEQRNIISGIVVDFIENNPACDGYDVKRVCEYENKFIQVIIFKAYGKIYFWMDAVEDGNVSVSHLEAIEDEMAYIIYTSTKSDKTPSIPKLLKFM